MEAESVDLDLESFGLEEGETTVADHLGRRALRFEEGRRDSPTPESEGRTLKLSGARGT